MLRQVLLHQNGPALWPEHKPLEAVLRLKATTPEGIWAATYQGQPTTARGAIFQRSWYAGAHSRYDPRDPRLLTSSYARYQSWDTSMGDQESNAWTVCVTGDLLPDYRLAIRSVLRDRWQFPQLPPEIEAEARRHNRDNKLAAVLIEDKASGTSALQTLRAVSPAWLSTLLYPFVPTVDKTSRANQAAVWCKNGSVLLPMSCELVPWLFAFEEELFEVPGSPWWDQVDALAQLILYLEPRLHEGWELRQLSSVRALA